MTDTSAISATAATVRFGHFTALDNVTLSVQKGEILGLLGPNGSGKTTFMRAACGLQPLAAGEIRIFGQSVKANTQRLRRQIGYMSQSFAIYEDLTAEENIDFYAGIYGVSRSAKRLRKAELVGMTGLAPYLHQRSDRLSGGWRQRLALVCTLLHNPQLVFLDEPTAGIDPVARRQLWDLFFAIARQGVTFVVSTHYMEEAERCDRIAYLHLSRMLAVASPQQLRQCSPSIPAGMRRVEIACGDAATTLARLLHTAAVHEATIVGQGVQALIHENVPVCELGMNAHDEHLVRQPLGSLEDALWMLSQTAINESAIPEKVCSCPSPQPA